MFKHQEHSKENNTQHPSFSQGQTLSEQGNVNNSEKSNEAAQLQEIADSFTDNKRPIQAKNNTGLPNQLKSGIENLSGYSLDDVKVHYNSNKPAQLQAHAYAQGNQIYVGPGQQKHLPHEAWHVVQQKQGRVKSTLQLKNEISINDDENLEREADIMGEKAANLEFSSTDLLPSGNTLQRKTIQSEEILQAQWNPAAGSELRWDPPRSGLVWFYNTATRKMRFEPENPSEDLGPIASEIGKEKSYRSWIKEWESRDFISAEKAESLSFSNYISHIIEVYPPERFEYIGIGASTDLVFGYIDRKYGIPTVNIPISGVSNVPTDPNDPTWTPEKRRRVQDYILGFVPIQLIMGNKNLVLMDVSSSGKTLTTMEQLFREIITAHGGNPKKVSTFSLNTTIKPDKATVLNPGPLDDFDTNQELAAGIEESMPSPEEQALGFLPPGRATEKFTDFKDTTEQDEIEDQIDALEEELDKLDPSVDSARIEEINAALTPLKERFAELDALPDPVSFYPRGFGVMISEETDIEQNLDSQIYKDLGRSHAKVNISSIQDGDTTAEFEKTRPAPEGNGIPDKISSLLHHERE